MRGRPPHVRIKAAGGRVLVTGVRGSSTGLLAAAAEGRLRRTLLSKSDPAEWIAGTRGAGSNSARRSASEATKPDERGSQAGTTVNNILLLNGHRREANETVIHSEKPRPQKPAVPPHARPSIPAPKPTRIPPNSLVTSTGAQKKATSAAASTSSSLRQTLRGLVQDKWKVLGLLAGALAAALAILIVRDRVRVMRRRAARPSFGLPRSQAAFSLVTALNGRDHVLGKLDRLHRVRVGRDAANAVVLDAPGVERHHSQLVRRGRRWLLENLSRKPVDANGSPVAAGKAAAAEFPALVRLGDQASVRFLGRAESSKEAAKPVLSSEIQGSLTHAKDAQAHVA